MYHEPNIYCSNLCVVVIFKFLKEFMRVSHGDFRTSTVEGNYYDSGSHTTEPLCAGLAVVSEKDSYILHGDNLITMNMKIGEG